MPCYTLILYKKQIVYRLSDMIAAQYDVDTAAGEVPIGTSWRELNIQSDYENVESSGEPTYIKAGDKDLSGLRWGYMLAPGETKRYRLSSAFTATSDKYFLCESADNVKLNVELI